MDRGTNRKKLPLFCQRQDCLDISKKKTANLKRMVNKKSLVTSKGEVNHYRFRNCYRETMVISDHFYTKTRVCKERGLMHYEEGTWLPPFPCSSHLLSENEGH